MACWLLFTFYSLLVSLLLLLVVPRKRQLMRKHLSHASCTCEQMKFTARAKWNIFFYSKNHSMELWLMVQVPFDMWTCKCKKLIDGQWTQSSSYKLTTTTGSPVNDRQINRLKLLNWLMLMAKIQPVCGRGDGCCQATKSKYNQAADGQRTAN